MTITDDAREGAALAMMRAQAERAWTAADRVTSPELPEMRRISSRYATFRQYEAYLEHQCDLARAIIADFETELTRTRALQQERGIGSDECLSDHNVQAVVKDLALVNDDPPSAS
jgi:hypothetical protein